MTNRRVWLGSPTMDGRPIAAAEGVAGEDFDTEVYHPYGLSANVEGEGVLLSMNGDADNHQALGPRGDRLAPAGTVLIYYGETTEIELSEDRVVIRVPGGELTIGDGRIETDMDILTSGDVRAGTVSLRRHKHTGVQTGGGVSGVPV